MTTNERMNAGRYKHFHAKKGEIKSPFHRGYLQNLIDVTGTAGISFNWSLSIQMEQRDSDSILIYFQNLFLSFPISYPCSLIFYLISFNFISFITFI